MGKLVLTGLIAAAVAGIVGFSVGRRTTTRIESRPTASPRPQPKVPEPPSESAATVPESVSTTAEPAADTKPAKPADSAPTPRRKLIDLIGSMLSEEKHYHALIQAATSDPAVQKQMVEELLATQDPEMLKALRSALYGVRDPALIQEIVDAFGKETWAERRATLATVIGMNLDSETARAQFFSILAGADDSVLKSALYSACVQNLRQPDQAAQMSARLTEIVSGSGPSSLRTAAARALRGDRTEAGVNFLLDRMLNDSDPQVQHAAMVALPVTYSSGGPHDEIQYRTLLGVALDEKRPEKMRKWAADRALMGVYRVKNLMTDEQRELMNKLAGRNEPSKGKPN